MYWRYIMLALLALVSSTSAMETSLKCDTDGDGDSVNCALLDARIDANNEIDFPASFDRHVARQLTSIEIKRSNFKFFPSNLIEVMPNLKSITVQNCGLVMLNATNFGFASTQDLEDVESLHLGDNQLETLKAYTFSQAKGLIELQLANNRLSNIDAAAFYGLSRLDVLDLSHNLLDYLDVDVFLPLVSLHRIVLKQNQFQVFNLDIFRGNVKLFDVYLANNALKQVQATLVNNVAKYFDLSANQLVDISALGKMKGMDTLVLSGNKNVNLRPNAFSEMGQLKQLLLEDIDLRLRLNNEYVFLTPLRQLQILFIARNRLTSLNRFPNLPELRSLIANENDISTLDVNALKAQQPKLEDLNIINNRWNCQVLTKVFDEMNKLRIRSSFHSSTGREEPAMRITNVEGVICTNDDIIPIPTVPTVNDDLKYNSTDKR
jgi:Leucine-rich repeat (LRR) protein